MKTCSGCGQRKDLLCFHKMSKSSDGLNGRCKECVKKYYEENKHKYPSNKYYKKNRKKILKRKKEYGKKNRKEISKKRKERYHSDKGYRIVQNLRTRARDAISNRSLSGIMLLGYDQEKHGTKINFRDFLISYLESLFQEGMSWENYGNPNGDHTECWHIDHIMPCSSFNLQKVSEQKKCFHYTNLQPLWAEDNLLKGDTILSYPLS